MKLFTPYKRTWNKYSTCCRSWQSIIIIIDGLYESIAIWPLITRAFTSSGWLEKRTYLPTFFVINTSKKSRTNCLINIILNLSFYCIHRFNAAVCCCCCCCFSILLLGFVVRAFSILAWYSHIVNSIFGKMFVMKLFAITSWMGKNA